MLAVVGYAVHGRFLPLAPIVAAVAFVARVGAGRALEALLSAGEGLDAATGEYKDLVEAGIIDPAKVTRSALQNAASIAALFLTTEAVVADKPEKAPAMPGGDMGGMGM